MALKWFGLLRREGLAPLQDTAEEHAPRWYEYLWPMGGVLSASLFIAWGTEVLGFFLSRGLAFALLALLQVLPEFAVEAGITFKAGFDPATGLNLVTANFTGANRLIVGLFVPMTFYVAAWRARRRGQSKLRFVQLPATSSLETVFLLVPTLIVLIIGLRGRLSPVESVLLFFTYLVYLGAVYRLPSEAGEEELPFVPRTIRTWSDTRQKLTILALFLIGGALLFLSIDPFIENTKHLGTALGLNAYFLFQWLAPFLSEFPEFITILYWSRTGRSPLGVTNAISSNINQLTLLIGMLPFAFAYGSWSAGRGTTWEIPFDPSQRVEIILTVMQMLFAALVLLDLRLDRWQAHTLMGLWILQLFDPIIHEQFPNIPSPLGTGFFLREWLIFVYGALCIFVIAIHKGQFVGFSAFRETWATYVKAPRRSAVQK